MSEALDFNEQSDRNWIRAAYGLKFLKQGLEGFIDRQIKQQHEDLKHELKNDTTNPAKSCDICTSDNLLPNHPTRGCIQKFRSKCFCSTRQNRRKCPNQFCSRFYDSIVKEHAEGNPNWQNTDPSGWYSDYWELAKCFLGTTGYLKTYSASETDITGLLSIVINDLSFKNAIDKLENFQQAREIRNEIFHRKMFQVTEDEVGQYVDRMIDILQDKSGLLNDTDAKKAVDQLSLLKQNQIYISTEDAEDLRKKFTASMKDVTDKYKCEVEEIKAELASSKKAKIDERSLRQYLLDFYKNSYCKTDISPLKPEEDVDVDEMYVPVKLEGIYKDCDNKVRIETVEQLLCLSKDFSKNIFVFGDVGSGKTTICKRLVSLWCHAHTNSESGQSGLCLAKKVNQYNFNFESLSNAASSEDHKEKHVHTDTETMLTFDFLFVISLRYANNETYIEEMIQTQLYFKEFHSAVFYDIMNSDCFKCLVIVDGLDEWDFVADKPKSPNLAQELPRRKTLGYTVLYTTRPWKTAESKIKSSEISLKVYSTKTDYQSSSEIVKRLKTKKQNRKNEHSGKTFFESVNLSNLNHLMTTPLVVKMLYALFEKHAGLPESRCRLYCEINELLLQYTYERNETDSRLLDALRDLKRKRNDVKLSLPNCFGNLQNISKHIYLVHSVSAVAFKLYFNAHLGPKKDISFTKKDVLDCGLTSKEIQVCLKIGLLTKEKARSTPTSRESAISFTHLPLQEFFVAVYIALHPEECLKTLEKVCKDLNALTELSSILSFVYGMYSHDLQPFNNLLEHVIRKQRSKLKESFNLRNISTELLVKFSVLYSDCTFENKFSGTVCDMDFQFLYLSDETSVSLEKTSSIIRPRHLFIENSARWWYTPSTFCDILCNNSDRIETLSLESIDIRGCRRLQALMFSSLSSLTLIYVNMNSKQIKTLIRVPTLHQVYIRRLNISVEEVNQAHRTMSKILLKTPNYDRLIQADNRKVCLKLNSLFEQNISPSHICSELNANIITLQPENKTVNSLKSLILTNTDLTSLGELFSQSLPSLEYLKLRSVTVSLAMTNGILMSPKLQHVHLSYVAVEVVFENHQDEKDFCVKDHSTYTSLKSLTIHETNISRMSVFSNGISSLEQVILSNMALNHAQATHLLSSPRLHKVIVYKAICMGNPSFPCQHVNCKMADKLFAHIDTFPLVQKLVIFSDEKLPVSSILTKCTSMKSVSLIGLDLTNINLNDVFPLDHLRRVRLTRVMISQKSLDGLIKNLLSKNVLISYRDIRLIGNIDLVYRNDIESSEI